MSRKKLDRASAKAEVAKVLTILEANSQFGIRECNYLVDRFRDDPVGSRQVPNPCFDVALKRWG